MVNCKYEAILLNVNFNFKRISKLWYHFEITSNLFWNTEKVFLYNQ